MLSVDVTVAKTARFSTPVIPREQMAVLGQQLADTVRERIQSGINVSDSPAKPLSHGKPRDTGMPGNRRFAGGGYEAYKSRNRKEPIRNWTLTGEMWRHYGLVYCGENEVWFGFDKSDPLTMKKFFVNQRREPMFGLSPTDRIAMAELVHDAFRRLD